MADRVVETTSQEVPALPEALEEVLLAALDEAKKTMGEGKEVVPFTMLMVKDAFFIEEHPGNNADECYNLARHTVQGARGADAYALCYDGYVDIDDGQTDALIAEGGVPGDVKGYAVGYLYEQKKDGTVEFEKEPVYIGEAPNFMLLLKPASDYAEDEVPEEYRDADAAEEDAEDAAE